MEKISQIYLSEEDKELPYKLKEASKSIKIKYPDCKYKLYNAKSLREFISNNFDKEVLYAYEILKPFAYKADLGRYCLLYINGGWYFDISIICKAKYEVEKKYDLLVFRDELKYSETSWAVSNGIIWSKPKNNIFRQCIDDVIRNCREKWYGKNPLYPTGPVLFGEAIAKRSRNYNILIGKLDCPTIPFTNKGIPFLKSLIRGKFKLPNGKTIGMLKSSKGGDLTSLGGHGTNNYNILWNNEDIYF
tara:strand:+ start:98 stop:835 length:738 start_codon:yes stop_codon:yes gene_type:complete